MISIQPVAHFVIFPNKYSSITSKHSLRFLFFHLSWLALQAVSSVHTDHSAAGCAGPFAFFIFYKFIHPPVPYLLQVTDHVDRIFGAVALIQLLDPGTGECIAFIAEF